MAQKMLDGLQDTQGSIAPSCKYPNSKRPNEERRRVLMSNISVTHKLLQFLCEVTACDSAETVSVP
jgi:hypothetical protein